MGPRQWGQDQEDRVSNLQDQDQDSENKILPRDKA